jgi:hypothetical protein
MSFGKLLEPDIPQKMAFIDMGSRERIKPGMKFLVARWGKQGGFDYKGEVEVKKVWMTYSEVSITDVFNAEVPMVDGDMLVNPLFNPRRSVVVCFAGERRMHQLKFPTVVEAANRIREMGGTVRDTVTLDCDYVIFTEDSKSPGRREDKYPNFGKAVLLEVPVAEAKEVFRFLGD